MSKIAVVTGGGKVIGWFCSRTRCAISQDEWQNLGGLIAKSLAKDGYGVMIHYNSPSSKDESEATVKAIINDGGNAWSFGADLTNVDEIAKLFSTAKSKGKITVAINTAGKVLKKPILEVSMARHI